jgi:hypothetical protein
MKHILSVLLVCSIATAPVYGQTSTAATNSAPMSQMFTDVPKDHWAYDSIDRLTRDGVMIGYFDKPLNTFRGERTLTRYEFAYALAHAIDRIQENMRKEQRSQEIEEYLKNKNVDPKALEAFTMLLHEFKAELNDLNIRVTRLEEKTRNTSSASSRLPLYFSIAAVLLSLVSLTLSVQK